MASTVAERTGRRRSRRADLGPAAGAPHGIGRVLAGLFTGLAGLLFLVALVVTDSGLLTDGLRALLVPQLGLMRWFVAPTLLFAAFFIASRRRGSLLKPAAAGLLAFCSLAALAELLLGDGGHLGELLGGAIAALVTIPGAIATYLALLLAASFVLAESRTRSALEATGGALAATGRLALARLRGTRDEQPDDEDEEDALDDVDEDEDDDEEEDALDDVDEDDDEDAAPEIPEATPSDLPVSATLAPAKTAPTRVKGRMKKLPPVAGGAEEWTLPPLELLDPTPAAAKGAELDHETNRAIIEQKLASFGLATSVAGYHAGPTVTQYEITPDPRVKLSKIDSLADDLAMALAARSIRIEAPIPGKALVGIEIPNPTTSPVGLRAIFEEVDFEAMGSKLTFALGRGVAGEARAADLARMPHLLVAGATGSGKSVMINAILVSLLLRATPAELRLILVDPKRVELAAYEAIPHLLTPLVTEPEKAKRALLWAVGEMERRYKALHAAKARNLAAYNETRADPADRMPLVLIVIDELADLMLREGKQVEEPIVRLAQKARAVGIHVLLATQRPSVKVVTGLLKANIPSRVAFGMASQIDSRTVLDAAGAEDLLGRGDMLYQPSDMPKPIRLQGVLVTDREIRAVTEAWRSQGDPAYIDDVAAPGGSSTDDEEEGEVERDELFDAALGVIAEHDRASASLLQRRLRIGYARAARLLDALEDEGYIGAADGSNARAVLVRDDDGF
jgi:S-DNA-T family DNA segregation ATPase FtsK/SpoIIIE